jgi:L-asparaginase II
MEEAAGRLVAKGGAEGLECVGFTESGLGLAVKTEDGAARALGPAVVAVLERLGVLSASDRGWTERLGRPIIRNVAGLEVGRIEARVSPLAPAAI